MIYRRALRPILFSVDAEFAHERTLEILSALGSLPLAGSHRPFTHAALQTCVAGVQFPNPVGLAAGCDKNGKAVTIWPGFGFGFVEVGTVTAQPQSGNPKPRVFRLQAQQALINRLGFNSEGAAAVATRLARLRRGRPLTVPLGINIGKTRLVTGESEVLQDYCASYRRLADLADYIVINISSPNTPGLREWQERERLTALIEALKAEPISSGSAPPLFVKISPDMSEGDMEDVLEVALDLGVAGVIATNTTLTRSGSSASESEQGGMSGLPLRERANSVLKLLYRRSEGRIPLIGVGGISSAEDAYDRIRSGASLLQLYTALVYEGPLLARDINAGLLKLMERDGIKSIREAIGTAA